MWYTGFMNEITRFRDITRRGTSWFIQIIQYCQDSDVQEVRWSGHVARRRETNGKHPLGRVRSRWENNVKMDLMQIACEDQRWVKLAQDRVQWPSFGNSGFWNHRVSYETLVAFIWHRFINSIIYTYTYIETEEDSMYVARFMYLNTLPNKWGWRFHSNVACYALWRILWSANVCWDPWSRNLLIGLHYETDTHLAFCTSPEKGLVNPSEPLTNIVIKISSTNLTISLFRNTFIFRETPEVSYWT